MSVFLHAFRSGESSPKYRNSGKSNIDNSGRLLVHEKPENAACSVAHKWQYLKAKEIHRNTPAYVAMKRDKIVKISDEFRFSKTEWKDDDSDRYPGERNPTECCHFGKEHCRNFPTKFCVTGRKEKNILYNERKRSEGLCFWPILCQKNWIKILSLSIAFPLQKRSWCPL